MILKIEKEFRSLIPSLTAEEYAGLEKSIISEGCRDALIVWNEIIVDGHHRYEICTKYGIEFKTVNMEFTTKEEAKEWIIRNQFARRNLSAYDRSILALKLKDLIAAKAKAKQATHTKQGYQKSGKAELRTDNELASIAGVSHDTIFKVEKIEAAATEEIKQKIRVGELTINRAYTEIKRQEIKDQAKEIEPPEGKYRVIYADPPWQYNNTMPEYFKEQADHYPTMTIEEICNLPIKEKAEDNAVLFLWVTSPILEESFQVVKAWGFEYKASYIWDKVKHNMGHYNSVRHELLLICTRGSCMSDIAERYDSVLSIERGKHSEKPGEFRALIDTSYLKGKRIELFARGSKEIKNWTFWGNEIDKKQHKIIIKT